MIVELGAGTGSVTECALDRCHPRSRLLAIELDAEFASILRTRCPRAIVLEGNALDVSRHLADAGVHRVDLMISGLALPSLDAQTRQAVLDSFRALAAPGAWFSQLTVMPLVFLRFYRRLCREVRFQWALWNAPPAGVYHCRAVQTSADS
jgi:phospholipid N-methyltransferase